VTGPRTALFGLPFDAVDRTEALARITDYVRSGRPHLVFCANVSCLSQWRRDPLLQRVYRQTDLLTVDGMALYYASRLLGTPVPDAVSGSDLFDDVLAAAERAGYRVYFLGARPDVLERAVRRVRQRHPALPVAGWRDGYFGPAEEAGVVAAIRAAAPDVLLLGISSPKKERFAWQHRDALGVPVVLGVGGMFDIAAGLRSRAPAPVRRLCLEWAWRLAQEPRRLLRRYTVTNAEFLLLLARELVRTRLVRARPLRTRQ
jgi:N-acetylglucosaminyldiphosphoundecaprenol N-acetyl-beta-D-mannosaminyltransferase